MKNVWEVWADALDSGECDEIVARAAAYQPNQAAVGFEAEASPNSAYRSSTVRWMDVARERTLVDRLMGFVHSSNRTNFGVDVAGPFDLQFTEYHGAVGGKYDWHHDVWLESDRPYDRKLSVVVQLSDPADYEGGAFEFFALQSPGAAFAGRGSLLIFPSFLLHRVLPVTRGCRRSLVTWIEGPRWR